MFCMANSECSRVESLFAFCRSPCIFPAAEKTRSGPAEEAFLRHRARLHVEARRRARREQLKDPLERVARFRAVAAATAPAPKKKG